MRDFSIFLKIPQQIIAAFHFVAVFKAVPLSIDPFKIVSSARSQPLLDFSSATL